ncbi:MAG: hypothetical protein ACXQS2_00550, partial [Methermicoccaceae archaeon]
MTNMHFIRYAILLISLVIVLMAVNWGSPTQWFESTLTPSEKSVTGDTSAGLNLEEITFRISDRRYIQALLSGESDVEVREVWVNGDRIFTWTADSLSLSSGNLTRLTIYFQWNSNETYMVEIVTSDGEIWDTITARNVKLEMSFQIDNVNYTESSTGEGIFTATYDVYSSGYYEPTVMAFLSENYSDIRLPVVIFRDENFMPNETIERANELGDILEQMGEDVR